MLVEIVASGVKRGLAKIMVPVFVAVCLLCRTPAFGELAGFFPALGALLVVFRRLPFALAVFSPDPPTGKIYANA